MRTAFVSSLDIFIGCTLACPLAAALLVGCASHISEQRPEPLNAGLASQIEAAARTTPDTADWQLEALPTPGLVDLPYADIINPLRPLEGTLSMGNTSTGVLASSREIPVDAQGFYVLPSHTAREAHYATEELYALVDRAGRALAERYPGTRIPLGDASGPEGGDLRHHASHNSGRDLDIPFLIRSPSGRELTTTRFVTFDSSLRNGRAVFDVERNWFLVRTLIEESHGTLQWIFVSDPLRQVLLDHARQLGEPEWVLEAAQDLLWQPSDSAPHDDHFHIRLYCSRDDRLEGCIDYGPTWPWARTHIERHAARVDELMAALDDESVQVRVEAVAFLRRIDGFRVGAELARQLPLQPPEVQLEILSALQQFRPAGVGPVVVDLYRASEDPAVRLAALETLASYPMPGAAAALVELVETGGDILVNGGTPVARYAARGLLDIQEPELVGALIPLLESPDRQTRTMVASALARTTARTPRRNWAWLDAEGRSRGAAEWQAWLDEHRDLPRGDWIRQGFRARGYELPDNPASMETVEVLVEAVHESEPVGYLALELLREITGRRPPPPGWSHARQREYWLRVAAEALE